MATILQELIALSGKRIWFAHQSVGSMIMHGPAENDAAGLVKIFDDNPTGGVSNVTEPANISAIPPGTWADSFNGTNIFPYGKVSAFNTAVRTTFSGQLDYAILKFCWVDFGITGAGTSEVVTESDADTFWTTYKSVMDALEVDFPGRIIYCTVPLTPSANGDTYNDLREYFSNKIRTEYGSTDRVFDVADFESRNSSGQLILDGDSVRQMHVDWDGGDGGHPNVAGANMLGEKLLTVVYNTLTAGNSSCCIIVYG